MTPHHHLHSCTASHIGRTERGKNNICWWGKSGFPPLNTIGNISVYLQINGATIYLVTLLWQEFCPNNPNEIKKGVCSCQKRIRFSVWRRSFLYILPPLEGITGLTFGLRDNDEPTCLLRGGVASRRDSSDCWSPKGQMRQKASSTPGSPAPWPPPCQPPPALPSGWRRTLLGPSLPVGGVAGVSSRKRWCRKGRKSRRGTWSRAHCCICCWFCSSPVHSSPAGLLGRTWRDRQWIAAVETG